MKKYIVFLLICTAGLSSCKKFLEEKPYSFLGNANFYQTEGDANAALNGVFSPMQAQTYYGRTSWLISELTGEDLIVLGSPTADRSTLNNYTYTASNGEIGNWWRNIYQLINRANDVIAYVPAINFDAARKNDIIGNARFLRGLAYFELLRSFGDVPLTLQPTNAQSDLLPKRTPVADVYKQVIEDLLFAEANCFAENKIVAANKGRVSSGAASAILAKVYLTRAATAAGTTADYTSALTACNRVISSGLYTLLPKYADIFDADKKNGPEHIFSVQFEMPPSVGNITIRMMLPSQAGGSGSFGASPYVFNTAYIAADTIRKNVNLSNKVGATAVAPYISKYRDVQWTSQSNNSRTNWIITRYADVLLMQSEALNQINPADPNKFNGINQVRTRAGLTAAGQQLNLTNTPTKDNFIDALVKERELELCMEGHRRWDLIRLGRIKPVLLATRSVVVDDNHLLFPIPQTEIALNPNLVQNPGF